MQTSSEYTFPIFISSTDYNLKDLRAELARFLTELGYRPIVSSAEGFPDSSPTLEPWESCLPVLEKCFVTILIIDGRYGSRLAWLNFKECFGDKKVSPTHAEYLFSHRAKQRMLVFIRKTLMPHYQAYRTTLEHFKGNKDEAKAALSITLPEYVNFDTLEFINEVKTTKPIPWINEFEDITEIKKQIQKKMLNELAELFLIKNKHLQTVIDSFNKVLDSLSTDEQKKVLGKVNAAKDLLDALNVRGQLEKELQEAKQEISNAKNSEKAEQELRQKIAKLQTKISNLEENTRNSESKGFIINNGQLKIDPHFMGVYGNIKPTSLTGNDIASLSTSSLFNLTTRCDNCGKSHKGVIYGDQYNTCPSCKRVLCSDCWPKNKLSFSSTVADLIKGSGGDEICPDCMDKQKTK